MKMLDWNLQQYLISICFRAILTFFYFSQWLNRADEHTVNVYTEIRQLVGANINKICVENTLLGQFPSHNGQELQRRGLHSNKDHSLIHCSSYFLDNFKINCLNSKMGDIQSCLNFNFFSLNRFLMTNICLPSSFSYQTQ
jgi:hypothetical protein